MEKITNGKLAKCLNKLYNAIMCRRFAEKIKKSEIIPCLVLLVPLVYSIIYSVYPIISEYYLDDSFDILFRKVLSIVDMIIVCLFLLPLSVMFGMLISEKYGFNFWEQDVRNIYPYIAYKINKKAYLVLQNVVEEIAIASGLKRIPDIYILDAKNIFNAFCCGLVSKKPSIVITKGLLYILTRDELQGVVAHEMSYIVNKNKSLAEEKEKECLADAFAVMYTRYPKGLADALLKIKQKNIQFYNSSDSLPVWVKNSFIVPVEYSLKSSNQLTERRIKILLNMKTADFNEYEKEFKNVNKRTMVFKSALKDVKFVHNGEITSLNTKNKSEQNISQAAVSACDLYNIVTDKNQVQTIKENKELLNKNIKKHREIDDMVRSLADYTVINCDCETKLKIPPVYKNTIIICPHCGKKHNT